MSSEAKSIAASDRPGTVTSLVSDLRALGLERGDIVIVHSSLSALGWIAGGAQAVVQALFDTVGADGTIVMPTQSGQLSDPGGWSDPPIPSAWLDDVRNGMPAFDPYLTPTRAMGQVVECFRQHRATIRSNHPTVSFAACGPQARAIVGTHPSSPGLGETSPLGRLYELSSRVLLLGVSHANNTSLHLAEHRATWPSKSTCVEGAPILVDGRRTWVEYEDLDLDEDDFEAVGAAFAASGLERVGPVAGGVGRISQQRDVVDFAVDWMSAHRS